MGNFYFTDKEFKDIKRENQIGYGAESHIYSYNNKILKIYKSNFLEHQEKVVDYTLKRRRIKGCAIPNGKVFIDDKFRGVTMDYYRKYLPLGKSLESKEESHKEKLIMCKKIVSALKGLHSNEFVHNDIHLNNIMYNLQNLDSVLIDIDGGTPRELLNDDDFYQKLRSDQYNLIVATLSYMYSFNFVNYIVRNGIIKFENSLNSFPIGEDLIKYVNDFKINSGENEYIDAYLDDMQEVDQNKVLKLW